MAHRLAQHIPERNVRRGFSLAFLLAAALFYFHTLVIFQLARWIPGIDAWLTAHFSHPIAGQTIIVGSFFALFAAHCLEATAWGLFIRYKRFSATLTEAIYFAAASITGLGYGDVVLPPPWRLIGPIIAISGLLIFGCSTAFLIVVIQRVWEHFL